MSTENSKAADSLSASVISNRQGTESVGAGGVFTVKCYDPEGNLKWTDTFHNLVVNQGLQDMNSQYFKGSGYTAAWYLGLITGPGSGTTFSGTQTLASHGSTGSGGWTENTNYTGNRKAVTFGTATTADPSVIDNSASTSSFIMNANAQVIAGAFLCNVSSGTSGILFSAGDFTGGDKTVDSGDTLAVTYTFSLDAT